MQRSGSPAVSRCWPTAAMPMAGRCRCGLLYDVLQRFDPEHLLLAQAEREVFEGQLEFARLASALEDCAARVLRLCTPRSLTPLSFPLWAERVRGQLSTEDWKARVLRAAAQLERKHGR